MSEYDTLITDARAFFGALGQNNKRDWWIDNKTTYDTRLKAPALALFEDLSVPLSKMADTPIKPKLFRPNRDVRFSKDKTPYHTHLHMMWQIESDAPQNPAFFFGIGLDYVTTGAGMMGFDKPVLNNWRKMVDLDTDRIMGIVDDLESKGFALTEPALKRVPPPFDKDHPAERLLRMKGVVAGAELARSKPLPDQILANFQVLWPLNDLLISIAEA